MAITWPYDVDEIIGGDLTAALAYVTPAGGAVVTAVAPVGLRNRNTGEVSFTTSLGLGKKLERIKRDPHVALAYHSREHGFSDRPGFVLVQGDATPATEPDREYLEGELRTSASRFMGPPKEGKIFWDRWLHEYYQDRIPVAIAVQRIGVWDDERAAAHRETLGAPAPGERPAQEPPAKGTGPRMDTDRAAKRLRALDHLLLSYVGEDGYPDIVPVEVEGASADGIRLSSARHLPRGGPGPPPSGRPPARRSARATSSGARPAACARQLAAGERSRR